ncbi:MAG: helix-turn-helix domain-containing protein [Clostridiales bacterium]|nr:helix-turn-helix domain-containing protein [Clostridiales bacterium]MDY4655272.1 helix-turn-helix transcriptional regulator [Eubacteriales bacterium]
MEKFTERLSEAIKASGKKQTEIAAEVGITKQCISDFKVGKSYPSIQTLALLCKVLDVSSDYLLGLEEEEFSLSRK